MKNILSSLNESEKKRILEMHINKTKSFLLEAPVAKSVQLDCALSTIDGMKMTQEMITKYCAQAQNKGTSNVNAMVEGMITWDQIVITSELSKFGAKSATISVGGDMYPKNLYYQMSPEKKDKSGNIATPNFVCLDRGNPANTYTAQNWEAYFTKGSPEYNAFISSSKTQCQASIAKWQQTNK
jgi:hypothetical protein